MVGVLLILELYLVYMIGFNFLFLIVALVLVVILFTFSNMTVTVNEQSLSVYMGMGLITKKIRMVDIKSFGKHKKLLYNVWGIKRLKNGWIFSIEGFESVKVEMKNNQVVVIGTENPEKLLREIERFNTNKVTYQ